MDAAATPCQGRVAMPGAGDGLGQFERIRKHDARPDAALEDGRRGDVAVLHRGDDVGITDVPERRGDVERYRFADVRWSRDVDHAMHHRPTGRGDAQCTGKRVVWMKDHEVAAGSHVLEEHLAQFNADRHTHHKYDCL